MKARALDIIHFNQGFASSLIEDDEGDYLAAGSENLIVEGDGQLMSFKGMLSTGGTGSSVLFPFGTGTAGLANTAGTDGKGSVFAGPNLAAAYIGFGNLIIDGVSLATLATTTPALRLLRSGSYTGSAANGPFTWGLPAPLAGVLSATGSGSLTSAISIKHSWVRNSTGAEGNASPASNVITFNSQLGPYVISETPPNGADRVRLYASPRGFGGTGPHYYFTEKLASAFAGSTPVNLDFSDADLQPRLAPIDFNVPPVGVWAFQLESVWVVVGCYGDTVLGATVDAPGNSAACSRINRYEAFPADFIIGLPTAPSGMTQRASDGLTYVWGTSWLGAFSFTGGVPPVSFELLWANTGFFHQYSATIGAGGQLYGFSSKRGPIRIGVSGLPDTEFAQRIVATTRSWDARFVRVGWDSDHTIIVYMYGLILLAFNTMSEKWCAPVDLSAVPMSMAGEVVSAASSGGAVGSPMTVSINNAGSYGLYLFNAGSSGSVWKAFSTWRNGKIPEFEKTVGPVRGTFKHDNLAFPDITTKIFRQDANKVYQTTTPTKTVVETIAAVGTQHMPVIKSNVRKAIAYSVFQSARGGASGNSGPVKIVVQGTVSETRAS